MTTKSIGILGALALVLISGISYAGCAFGFRSDCIKAEAGIKAQYSENQNNYDNMWKKFREASQVNESYAKDLKEIYQAAITGRYGASGSQAAMQWIKEQNPTIDSATYTKLQAMIEAGRNEFEAEQKQLIDRKREYEVFLGSTTALFVNPLFGFPRIDLSKYDIVTSSRTEKAFEEKKDDEIKLR
jgi:hypothetical protein